MDESFRKYAQRDAYAFMDRVLHVRGDRPTTRRHSARGCRAAACARGRACRDHDAERPAVPDRAGRRSLRAGYVVVNVNPLYTPRELEHQLKDSGAEAIVILENFAATLQQVIARTAVKHVVVASIGDLLGFPKGAIVNFVVRRVKKMVPAYSLPGHVQVHRRTRGGRAAASSRRWRSSRADDCVPAVHRRHHRRVEGRDADAPQPRRQRAADRGLDRAGAPRHAARAGARAVRLRLRAAAVSRLRADRELPRAACGSAR